MIGSYTKKCIATFFLFALAVQTFYPTVALALTSGPAQPEMSKFEPAGASDLVDLFTGDLKYNIPLLDVGGYPVNMSFSSGGNMDDEAGWVGFGWTLNPGSVTRSLRGLPDDFNGDRVIKSYTRKEFKKLGGDIVLKPEIFGFEKGKASVKVTVFSDNYYGIGAEVGLSLAHRLAGNRQTALTVGLGVDITSGTRDGVSISPSVSLMRNYEDAKERNSSTITGGFNYNSRAGLKSINLSTSFSTLKEVEKYRSVYREGSGSATTYFGQTYTPGFNNNLLSSDFALSFDAGPQFFGGYVGVGGSGFYHSEIILDKINSAPAYGYMNYLKGRLNKNALLDFNRENDGVFIPGMPAIAMPVATHDFFLASNQSDVIQFRPYFSGDYNVFDRLHTNVSSDDNLGLTLGAGNIFEGGGRVDVNAGIAQTKKWDNNNNIYLHSAGEASFDVTTNPFEQDVYFKKTGEQSKADGDFLSIIGNENAARVAINNNQNLYQAATALPYFESRTGRIPGSGNLIPLKKGAREIRTSTITYLNAEQAANYALDKKIKNWTINSYSPTAFSEIQRNDGKSGIKKSHHISEITTSGTDGSRMIYGVPVYNYRQDEVNFSVGSPASAEREQARRTGLVSYSSVDDGPGNTKGRDNLYSKQTLPSYATSFLLSAILSPDYVDLTGDGISDDDLGTAVRFNYSRVGDETNRFKWRAPFEMGKANYNEGFLSDKKDDKASYVYGEKEIWYLHSIESKTAIAFFILSDREDGLGVAGNSGGASNAIKLKKLDRIELYSKADYAKNGANAIPVKVVHFEYDYSICPSVPNNTGNPKDINGQDPAVSGLPDVNAQKGKLTLKKLYFTFGKNLRGITNPYEFGYDLRHIKDADPSAPAPTLAEELSDTYHNRALDRWGTYKPHWYNHLLGNATDGTLLNSEFPYTVQDDKNTAFDERKLADQMASIWQLNKIVTPAGSEINILYEADDYAYVQNRRAMQMCFVSGLDGTIGTSSGLIHASNLLVTLPYPITDSDPDKDKISLNKDDIFRYRYLNGESKVYYKIFTNIDGGKNYEYVYGYADIDLPNCHLLNDNTGIIALKPLNGYNPISKAAWQMVRTDLPQYAYDLYDNSDASGFGGNVTTAIKSIVQAFKNLAELGIPYERIATSRNMADRIDLSRSVVRLDNPDFRKIGGGARVRQVTISDQWSQMTGISGRTATYGQVYDYTCTNDRGIITSSGVAAYEPSIGNEENPFHEPASYTEKVYWSADRYHYVQKPYCESYFPGPSVGYSKVAVTNIGDNENYQNKSGQTGYTENEFYTAKDFPTRVDFMPLVQTKYQSSFILKLFASTSVNRVVASQGFVVVTNDMHGKPKSTAIFNKSGERISAQEFTYNVKDNDAPVKQLNNNVDVLKEDGTIEPNTLLASDIDYVTDTRESTNENAGTSVGAYAGGFLAFLFPGLFAAVKVNPSYANTSFHSIAAVKVINQYGILKSVRNIKYGSTINSENLLWDQNTGQVVLSRTQNEFDDYTYALTLPAYYAYSGMGAAFTNSDAILTNFSVGSGGSVPPAYNNANILFPGDELVGLAENKHGWIVHGNFANASNPDYRFIDEQGNFLNASGSYRVLRSGHRNLLSAGAGTILFMNNPIVTINGVSKIDVNAGSHILESNAVTFNEEWPQPIPNKTTGGGTGSLDIPAPDIESNANYFIQSNSGVTCDGVFGAAHVPPAGGNLPGPNDFLASGETARGFIYFTGLNIPTGSTIVSATISLYAATNSGFNPPMQGANMSYLSRVTQSATCSPQNGTPTWSGQPAVTTANQVLLSQSINSNQDYLDIDIKGIVQDWSNARDLPGLGLRINLVDESTETDRRMLFYGVNGDGNGGGQPRLHIVYTAPETCIDPVGNIVNPYYEGLLGNWRAEKSFVYTDSRTQIPGPANFNGSTDIRRSGFYNSFSPFWNFGPGGLSRDNATLDANSRWQFSSQSLLFDRKGNPVESVDALQRYSAVLFGYRESVATAVAANARRNEIAFDGFEDYDFDLQSGLLLKCPLKRQLDWGLVEQNNSWCSPSACITNEKSHTGKYSLKLTGNVSLSFAQGSGSPSASSLDHDGSGHYILTANEMAQGFSPVPNKKYLLSLWVKDGDADNNPANTISGLEVNINGNPAFAVPLNQVVVPRVEGWKKLEIPFQTSSSPLTVTFVHSQDVYIDDLRVVPFDGQMNSFVYDSRSLRLLAQLDENNFATIYEYDDEGTPIRVKKETERGVMTLKENRQSFRNRAQ